MLIDGDWGVGGMGIGGMGIQRIESRLKRNQVTTLWKWLNGPIEGRATSVYVKSINKLDKINHV